MNIIFRCNTLNAHHTAKLFTLNDLFSIEIYILLDAYLLDTRYFLENRQIYLQIYKMDLNGSLQIKIRFFRKIYHK
jgi:hypothetical protein